MISRKPETTLDDASRSFAQDSCSTAKPFTRLDFPPTDKVIPTSASNRQGAGRPFQKNAMPTSTLTFTSRSSVSSTIPSRLRTLPSISTRIDEQEYLELADYYYNPRTDSGHSGPFSSTLSAFYARSRTSSITSDVHHRMQRGTPRDPEAKEVFTKLPPSPRHLSEHDQSETVDYDQDDCDEFEFIPTNTSPTVASSVQTSRRSVRKLSRPTSVISFIPASCFGGLSRWLWKKRKPHHLVPATETSCSTTHNQEEALKFASTKHSTRSAKIDRNCPNAGHSSSESVFDFNLDYDYGQALRVLVYDL